MLQVIESASAAARLGAARRFIDESPRESEILVVGASRGAADELVREVARSRGAIFGIHRASLTQLSARFAAPVLAAARLTPTTALGAQAVAARAAFEADRAGALAYFAPVASTPGFPRALARTLEELALAGVNSGQLASAADVGVDLSSLFDRFEAQFARASSVHRAAFFGAATAAASRGDGPFGSARVVLLDVPIAHAAERDFVRAVIQRSSAAIATLAVGDFRTRAALAPWAGIRLIEDGSERTLNRIRRHLFETSAPAEAEPLDVLELFSAPGEGREAIEIVRRVLREARRGVPFDRIAVAVRAPQQYSGLLEHAFGRAGIPAYFDRGTRRPHPAGRAFLAILACAVEGLSARRFAEYLSLGQVPDGVRVEDAFPASADDVFGAIADRAGAVPADDMPDREPDDEQAKARLRAARAPWRWEALLVESRVIGGQDRWARRLAGLIEECELRRRELARTDPDSPQMPHLARRVADLGELRRFALPIVRTLASWPAQQTWGAWLACFEALAPQVLRRPERVLRVLADLRPMAAVGPVGVGETAQVLADRLATIEADPPARRYGRVFVASPTQLRGRSFSVVFVPGLAERMFPQKPREDPLLLDGARGSIDAGLPTQSDRIDDEKLQLRLAVGAAEDRLYASFPTIETSEGRPRVPSLYALEVWRAMTGRVPGAIELQQTAAHASRASLAWPAPEDRDLAIDALEHDLATLRQLVQEPESRARGRAQYMLRLNEWLQRSVRERYMRGKRGWSHWDGLTRVTDATRPMLAAHRLGARPYSLSALQKFSACPYQFLLAAVHRLRPAEDAEPIQRLDPLTRGSLFHAIQAAFYRRLHAAGELPVSDASRESAFAALDAVVASTAAQYLRASRAGDRSRVAGRDRGHPPRPAAVGRPDCARRRWMGAEMVRMELRPSARRARGRARSGEPARSGRHRRSFPPPRIDRSRRGEVDG